MPKWILTVLFISSMLSTHAQEYAIGADLSFLKSAEDRGFVFKDEGEAKPGLEIFKDHGYNWIRLRLFHTPTRLPNSLDYTVALAKEAKDMGYKFLLDFHYSDTWADPQKQFLPVAWEGLTQEVLVDSVFEYTKRATSAFREAGAMPDMVQLGNEISNGMLWPNGKLPDNWDNFIELEQAGIAGVYAACGNAKAPLIMVQIDKGGDWEFTEQWFDELISRGVTFDVIGQSYYPWWHGSLLELRNNMHNTAKKYQMPIMLVEVAYCSEPTEYTEKSAPYPESPEGQHRFLTEVNKIVLNTPGNLGAGIMWWEPATFEGRSHRDFFDSDGNALPVMEVFDMWSRY